MEKWGVRGCVDSIVPKGCLGRVSRGMYMRGGVRVCMIGVVREEVGVRVCMIGVVREEVGGRVCMIGVVREEVGVRGCMIGVVREEVGVRYLGRAPRGRCCIVCPGDSRDTYKVEVKRGE